MREKVTRPDRPWRWVARDLSNGDGAERGVKRPTYIWAFKYRSSAREKVREHKQNPRYARLGPVEKWSVTIIKRHYTRGTGSYYVRKVNS